jgi:hypothetical protein
VCVVTILHQLQFYKTRGIDKLLSDEMEFRVFQSVIRQPIVRRAWLRGSRPLLALGRRTYTSPEPLSAPQSLSGAASAGPT